MSLRLLSSILIWSLLSTIGRADVVSVKDLAGLKVALAKLKSGTTIKIAAGSYPGGHDVRDVSNLTIEAADPENPPHFQGGIYAWHFSGCSALKLKRLRASGQTRNGFNLDDGGRADRPVRIVTLEHLDVRDVGPKGNFDGIKCSGLDDVVIRNCVVEGWGGEAIDMVGCHRVEVSDCKFVGKTGYSQSCGVQCKGGSENITIEKCEFISAGQRPINAGGSTGLEHFRPEKAKYEARRVVIRKNTISGSLCACSFTGVDGAEFTENTVLFPEKWIFRMLQENTEDGFLPSRNVVIENNSIVFRRSQVSSEVNVGPNTAPETFRFSKNRWFAEDRASQSRPKLPTEEKDGVYGRDPRASK